MCREGRRTAGKGCASSRVGDCERRCPKSKGLYRLQQAMAVVEGVHRPYTKLVKTSSKKWGTHHSPADGQAAINAVLVDVDPEKAGEIYDKVTISVLWILITVIVHCAQFAFLIEVARRA